MAYMNKHGSFHVGNIDLALGRAAAITNRPETQ